MPITRAVRETAEQHPDRLAIVGDDESLTYRQLVADSRRVFAVVDAAHRAQTAPPTPAPETGRIPITAVSLSDAFHTARIVAALAGYRAVSATLDPQWPLDHRVRVIVSTGIGVVVSDSPDLRRALADGGWTGTVLTLDEFRSREDAVEADDATAPEPTVRADDEAFLLLFSSGTTSDPKAFLKTRRQYRANVAVSAAHLEPLPGVATLAPGPLSYSLTLYALIECLATGGSAHLADAFDPVRMAARIPAESITRIVAVPAVVRALTDAARRDPLRFAGLDLVVTGGANLPAAIRDGLGEVLPHVRLISYYGAAEIGFIGDSRDNDGTLITLYDGILARIRDDDGRDVPDGELGTLWIHAEAASDGYLAATTGAVLRDDDGWATVHDQARIVDGRLHLAGRAGDIVVTGGHKVSLPDVERAFADAPGVGAVCAVSLPDEDLGRIVALVVEPAAAAPGGVATPSRTRSTAATPAPAPAPSPALDQPATLPDKTSLRAWARGRLAPQFVPRRWYVLPRLPRTAGGKIRRIETAERILAGEGVRL